MQVIDIKFKTKRDSLFIYIWVGMVLFINAAFLVPVIHDGPLPLTELLVLLFFDLIFTVFLIWIAMDISYWIKRDYLLVKGGIVRSKIAYSDIVKISRTANKWTGYRVLFSQDAIEVYYRTGFSGSVVISPENKEIFIAELLKRNTAIRMEG